eukprot:TRINITY_DN2424_c0_g1_i1.p2 TRINITY_DN2424_c0_g1~~TRINITY_DN2424_c0_g1_i1.p2  ORF type:complete len:118 (-),score=15.78 TRINITY_DN2424_c0_g1_i1:308-661(-)
MERFLALGDLEIHITELDVNLNGTNGTIASKWDAQADFYGNYLSLCLKYAPGCKSFETWDFVDSYTWLAMLENDWATYRGGYMFAPLPFDTYYAPKPAFYAMLKVLEDSGDIPTVDS